LSAFFFSDSPGAAKPFSSTLFVQGFTAGAVDESPA
jgi:hypothetical protein